MSESHEESYNPLEPPPHIKAILEHNQMHAEANAHERSAWINSLDEEGLIEFRSLVHDVVSTDGKSGFYYIGVATTLLENLGVCSACGHKHDEELANMKSDDEIAQEFEENLIEFNLERAEHGQLKCKGCGKLYVSLEDRMLRSASKTGCEGCMEKEKFG